MEEDGHALHVSPKSALLLMCEMPAAEEPLSMATHYHKDEQYIPRAPPSFP